jgi:8-oxo-dGTP pyrophosphatase MutT (NUDIX family)
MNGPKIGWRPPSIVRPIAIGIIRRREELLLMAVRNDNGAIKGWRPLGGAIEFGEAAADALRREFAEELGLGITEPLLLTVLENLYSHYGTAGHEIVFVFEARFADDVHYSREAFSFEDGGVRNEVQWVAISHFLRGEAALFPDGLLKHLP